MVFLLSYLPKLSTILTIFPGSILGYPMQTYYCLNFCSCPTVAHVLAHGTLVTSQRANEVLNLFYI